MIGLIDGEMKGKKYGKRKDNCKKGPIVIDLGQGKKSHIDFPEKAEG